MKQVLEVSLNDIISLYEAAENHHHIMRSPNKFINGTEFALVSKNIFLPYKNII
jgi:hypothetical protein